MRDTADGILHLLGGDHHQIRQLVDDNDHLRELLAVLLGGNDAVVGFQIPDAHVGHHSVAAKHFCHRPLQTARSLLGVGDHRDQQMGNTVVNAQLHHLGVNHDELHIVGTCLVQKANDDGIHAHGFTGTGGTGDQQVGHFGNVTHDAASVNALAQRNGGLGFCLGKLGGIDNLPQGDRRDRPVRHLDANHGNFSRNGGDADAGRAQTQGNIIGAAGDFIQPDALVKLHLVAGNAGAAGDVDDVGVDIEAGEGLIEAAGIFPHFLRAVRPGTHRAFQQIQRREAVIRLLHPLGLGDLRGDLPGRLGGVLGGDLPGLCLRSGLYLAFVQLGRGRDGRVGDKFRHFAGQLFPDVLPFRPDGLRWSGTRGERFGNRRRFVLHVFGSSGQRRVDVSVDTLHERRTLAGNLLDFILRCGSMGFFLPWGRTRLLFRRKLLGRLRRCFFRGVLPRPLLFPALTLAGDLLARNIVDYSRRRVYVVLFLHIIVLGAVGNGSDNAGNGDIHCPQQRQNCEKHAEHKGQRFAAEPAQQHGRAAAENAAGASRYAAGTQVFDQGKALRHLLLLHGKVVNAPAQKNEKQCADAPHGRGVFPAKGVDDEQV